MANDLTTTTTVSTIPSGTVIETYDTGSGHRQAITLGAAGTKTFTDPAPTTIAASIVAASATRFSVTIQNAGAVDCYLGKDNTVTASTGLLLAAGATLTDDSTVDAWWAITAAGTADLRILVVA